jgi:hypothetical protein
MVPGGDEDVVDEQRVHHWCALRVVCEELIVPVLLIYRYVEICRPEAHHSGPIVTEQLPGRWIDGFLVRFRGARPRNIPGSTDFSSFPRVGDLTLSAGFLNSSLYDISLKTLTRIKSDFDSFGGRVTHAPRVDFQLRDLFYFSVIPECCAFPIYFDRGQLQIQ